MILKSLVKQLPIPCAKNSRSIQAEHSCASSRVMDSKEAASFALVLASSLPSVHLCPLIISSLSALIFSH